MKLKNVQKFYKKAEKEMEKIQEELTKEYNEILMNQDLVEEGVIPMGNIIIKTIRSFLYLLF